MFNNKKDNHKRIKKKLYTLFLVVAMLLPLIGGSLTETLNDSYNSTITAYADDNEETVTNRGDFVGWVKKKLDKHNKRVKENKNVPIIKSNRIKAQILIRPLRLVIKHHTKSQRKAQEERKRILLKQRKRILLNPLAHLSLLVQMIQVVVVLKRLDLKIVQKGYIARKN